MVKILSKLRAFVLLPVTGSDIMLKNVKKITIGVEV